ncbi:MAG: DUF3501 family protein [Pseudomonadota bacterium]
MQTLAHKDLFSLEDYDKQRDSFRERIILHKKNRIIFLNENASLHFEDRLTMQYQIQEMLRAEKIFESELIQEELDAYNPLIPDGTNWKATFMLQYSDVAERKHWLQKLTGIENHVWVRVGDNQLVYPISNEDMERTTEDKTSSVHFMRFELTKGMVGDAQAGANISMGIDHPEFIVNINKLPDEIRASLISDLD